jgi:D-alanyl-lipoteichoic acid acyltransferase DltB (MBOAT superfamily)
MILNKTAIIWIISVVILWMFSEKIGVVSVTFPLVIVILVILIYSNLKIKFIEYLLFFSISLASLFGFAETLTGSHAESSSALLFGLSFYTASIAYFINKKKLNYSAIFAISNPLLLVTGPIAIFFVDISHKSVQRRIEYFAPFIIVGTFMFQVVGSPLTEFFFLIEYTDVVSSLLFAAIFEIFVYMNFCGLSLLIYGVFGLLGFRVPLNFKQPFSSRNIIEFWRGWHISLSQVLKVLFYAPIRRKYSLLPSLMAVYVASAMWHGVTLNFLLWGSFHALFFWLSILIMKRGNLFLALCMLPFIVIVGRLIFVESDPVKLIEKLTFSFDGFGGLSQLGSVPLHSLVSLCLGILIIISEFVFKNTVIMQKRNYKFLRVPLSLLLLSCIGLLLVSNVGTEYAVYGQR